MRNILEYWPPLVAALVIAVVLVFGAEIDSVAPASDKLISRAVKNVVCLATKC